MNKIEKAVFPVGGMGTRFLPATKASPKEMLPIVDKPLIQYAAEEAISAGITELIFVTGRTKQSITEHFSNANSLEAELEKQGKLKELEAVRSIIPDNISCKYITQSEPLGLGHAVLCAKSAVGNHPFALILPDDLIEDGTRGVTKQLVKRYEKTNNSIIAVENVCKKDLSKYGIVGISQEVEKNLFYITGIVEKPKPKHALSTLGVVGRYILCPQIFDCLENTEKGAENEIQLTDAIGMLLDKQSIHAYKFEGTRYDCGSKLGYIQASIQYALNDFDIGKDLKGYIQGL